jgi:hypothetical protein
MPLELVIRMLHVEIAKADRIIASLEALAAQSEPWAIAKKARRKFMGQNERREVSVRMKKFWAARRQAAPVENAKKSE